MARIALKIDVDTYRGTREGALRLASLLERLDIRATFLFSLGPDHTGRAVKRAFRRGFIGKVKRTSVLEHYGLKTLLYGTLLPGPHIGRSCREMMRGIASQGFEVGVHTFDHTKWQDGVAAANESWTRHQIQLAQEQFIEIFGQPAQVHGAAGWQLNSFVPQLEHSLGFRYASDVRGTEPFVPVSGGVEAAVPQWPTTLPTLDELIGRDDLPERDPVEHLTKLAAVAPARDHVFTLHAELEGGTYLAAFESLLRRWQSQGFALTDMKTAVAVTDVSSLPRCPIVVGEVPGRAGLLACQGARSTEVRRSM
jgi:peptidoglycan/xylan/chitin deacetylase (PgdA/CDA1 family)